MESRELTVRMFGEFQICLGERTVSIGDNRSRKTWLLLACLLHRRNRVVTAEELYEILWDGEADLNNPRTALRTVLHRARTLLRELGSEAGELILRRDGGYQWNPAVPMELDVERFETLLSAAAAAQGTEEWLVHAGRAVEVYRGEFLSRLTSEAWVRPIAVGYHDRFVALALETSDALTQRGRIRESVELCRRALEEEPYSEDFYQRLMSGLLTMQNPREVIEIYENMSRIFAADFGLMPSEESRRLYYEATKTFNDSAIPCDVLRQQLEEPPALGGALYCDYDFFKSIYHSTARLLDRSGYPVHLVLLNLSGRRREELSVRSRDLAMDNLQEQIRMNLRRGDVVSRCSVSQFVILLPMANYENSCMVCERIMKAFFRNYPHSPAKLDYTVCPLKNDEREDLPRGLPENS